VKELQLQETWLQMTETHCFMKLIYKQNGPETNLTWNWLFDGFPYRTIQVVTCHLTSLRLRLKWSNRFQPLRIRVGVQDAVTEVKRLGLCDGVLLHVLDW